MLTGIGRFPVGGDLRRTGGSSPWTFAVVLLAGCQPARDAPRGPAADTELLVTAAALRQRPADDAMRILDVRSPEAYAEGHIPGAIRLDLGAWEAQSQQADGLQDRGFWSAAIGGLGIRRGTHVVLYGDNLPATARAWWLLKYCGLKHAALLDGGWSAWQAAEAPADTEPARPESAEYPVEFQAKRLVEIAELQRSRQDPSWQLLDVRAADEYSGQLLHGSRAGRIPGAVHLEWRELLDEQGCFRPTAAIQQTAGGPRDPAGRPGGHLLLFRSPLVRGRFRLGTAGLSPRPQLLRGLARIEHNPDTPAETGEGTRGDDGEAGSRERAGNRLGTESQATGAPVQACFFGNSGPP